MKIYSNGETIEVPGGGSGSPGEVYSTEEQVIGTWIDGKPLYQKVITGVLIQESGIWCNAYSDSNISEFVSISGFITDTVGDRFPIPQASVNDAVITMIGVINSNTIRLLTNRPGFINTPVTLMCKYTKTTDPEVTTKILSSPQVTTTAMNAADTMRVTFPSLTMTSASAPSVNVELSDNFELESTST